MTKKEISAVIGRILADIDMKEGGNNVVGKVQTGIQAGFRSRSKRKAALVEGGAIPRWDGNGSASAKRSKN